MALEWDRAVRLAGMEDLDLLADFFVLALSATGSSRSALGGSPRGPSDRATDSQRGITRPKTSSPLRYRQFDKNLLEARLAAGWNILLLEDDEGLAGVAMMQISVSQATLGPVVALDRHRSQRAHLRRLISVAELLCQAKGCKKIRLASATPTGVQNDPLGQTVAIELGYQTNNDADEEFASKSL